MSEKQAPGPRERLYRLGLEKLGGKQSARWEIEHHIEEVTECLIGEGWEADSARIEAERRFGDVGRHERVLRRIDRGRAVLNGLRGAGSGLFDAAARMARSTRRSPGLVAGIVLTLSLGIGANAAMFSVLDRILLSPPAHVVDADLVRRVFLERTFLGVRNTDPTLTYPDVVDLRSVPEFVSAGAYTPARPHTRGEGEDAAEIAMSLATHDFFTTLGVRAHVGRLYGPDDDRIDAVPTAVLGWEYWTGAHGADPGVVGSTVKIEGVDFTVVGVAPRGLTGVDLGRVDVWLPMENARARFTGSTEFLDDHDSWWLATVVRLAEVPVRAAGEERATALHLNRRADFVERGWYDAGARIVTSSIVAARGPGATGVAQVSQWLAGVSLFVLLIACANVANLLLARSEQRRRESAIRLSFGVSRRRLVTESALEAIGLALVGGAGAMMLAWFGGSLLRSTLMPDVLWTRSPLDSRVMGFTVLVSIGAGILAGLGPAFRSTRVDLTADLRDGARGLTGRSRVRSALTVVQAALSTVLLVGAGLFLRSLDNVRALDLGLEPDRLVHVRLELTRSELPDAEVRQVYELARSSLEELPAVAAVTLTDIPFGWASARRVTVPGLDSIPIPPGGGPYYAHVSASYFETLGLEIVRGRALTSADEASGADVAVINQTMARALWPRGPAVGECFYQRGAERCTTVVGVVENASRGSLRNEPYMAFHLPLLPDVAPRALFVRAADDLEVVTAGVAERLRGFSRDVRYAKTESLVEYLDPQARSWRLGAVLLALFGGLALVVSVVGLYSLLAFDVARRVRELGVRAALGSGRPRTLLLILRRGIGLGLVGVTLGLGGSFALAPFVQELLFDVPARDPLVGALSAAALLTASVAASLLPALRATAVDPLVALRAE